VYLLAFDLRHDYSAEAWRRATAAARTLFDVCVPLYSAWLVETELSAAAIVDALLSAGAIHEGDGVVVLQLGATGCFRNIAAPETARWLREHLAAS
jgi:hypothetical protein